MSIYTSSNNNPVVTPNTPTSFCFENSSLKSEMAQIVTADIDDALIELAYPTLHETAKQKREL